MGISVEVRDRAGHGFTAKVSVRVEGATFYWQALLWDSGYMVDSVNGSSGSELAIRQDVATVVSEHTFHTHAKNRGI